MKNRSLTYREASMKIIDRTSREASVKTSNLSNREASIHRDTAASKSACTTCELQHGTAPRPRTECLQLHRLLLSESLTFTWKLAVSRGPPPEPMPPPRLPGVGSS